MVKRAGTVFLLLLLLVFTTQCLLVKPQNGGSDEDPGMDEGILVIDTFNDPATLVSWTLTISNGAGTRFLLETAAFPGKGGESGMFIELGRQNPELSFAGNLHNYFSGPQDWSEYDTLVFYAKGYVPSEEVNYKPRCILVVRQEGGPTFEGGDWNNAIEEVELEDGWYEISFPFEKLRPAGGAQGELNLAKITSITISISMPASYPYQDLWVYIDELYLKRDRD